MSFFEKVHMPAAIVILSIVVSINFSQPFYIDTLDSRTCKNTSVQCLSNNSYRTCVYAGSFTIFLNARLYCPDGYICNESKLSYPCTKQLDDENIDDMVTSPKTTQELVTTPKKTQELVTTPKTKKAYREVTIPICTRRTYKYWPAPACHNYYECVPDWKFPKIFFTNILFHPELRSCDHGKFFDTRYRECIREDESDC